MSKLQLLNGGQPISGGADLSQGVSFAYNVDFISKDTVSLSDTSSFTFAGWFYLTEDGYTLLDFVDSPYKALNFSESGGYFCFYSSHSADGDNAAENGWKIPYNTWFHIIISINGLTQKCYINDIDVSSSGRYSSNSYRFQYPIELSRAESIEFGKSYHPKRCSHVFFDTTYRDLDIEANRRLFITEDLKPAEGLASLNPPIYLPMTNASTAHINEGTGGDFVQNGTLATADRGANQYNCVATYNEYPNYLINNYSTPFNSNVITLSFNTIIPLNATQTCVVLKENHNAFHIQLSFDGYMYIKINAVSSNIYGIQFAGIPKGYNLSVQVSFDSTTAGRWHCIVNGKDYTQCGLTYSNEVKIHNSDILAYSAGGIFYDYYIGNMSDGGQWKVGEVYLNNTYTDLSTNNPFWDADNNRHKPVRQVLAETGANPLIAMPISADYPELNLGSAGNFTKNGTGFTGARGMSEYISRSCVVDGTNYLTGSVYCESLVKWTSSDGGATWNVTYSNAETVTDIGNGTNNGVVSYYFGFSDNINWALESNYNLVTNQLGFPRNPSDVINESGWTPVLGLFFNDTTNFGSNDYGSDFTQTGTISAGADVVA